MSSFKLVLGKIITFVKNAINKLLSPIYNIYSILYYGNTVAYYANKQAKQRYKSARNISKINPSSHYKSLNSLGYANLGICLEGELLQRVKIEFEKAINDPRYSDHPFDDDKIRDAYNHGQYQGSVKEFRRDIRDWKTAIPSIKDLIYNSQFINLIESTIGCRYEYDGINGWRNYHVPEDILKKFEVITNRFHFDSQEPDRFKIFIYMNDVTEKDGPFQHFPKLYSRYLLYRGFREKYRRDCITGNLPKNILQSKHLVKHTGTTGQTVICATSFCLHRAGEPDLGRYRDVIQICLVPSLRTEQNICQQ